MPRRRSSRTGASLAFMAGVLALVGLSAVLGVHGGALAGALVLIVMVVVALVITTA